MKAEPVRHRSFVDLAASARVLEDGWTCASARGKRFVVDWLISGTGKRCFAAPIEAIIVLPAAGARIVHQDGAVEAPPRSVVLCPPASLSVEAEPGAGFAMIRPVEGNLPEPAINNADYAVDDDEGILPLPAPSRRPAKGPTVVRADDIVAPDDKPRLKILRGATLSISWIEYEGIRDRTTLSPHSHPDFEQGSLALSGHFIHHLRTPWGRDANAWRDDEHLRVPSPSLCVIPPNIIHTTEGPHDEPHLLIDIFAPPRLDFLSKGWISNASDFDEPA